MAERSAVIELLNLLEKAWSDEAVNERSFLALFIGEEQQKSSTSISLVLIGK